MHKPPLRAKGYASSRQEVSHESVLAASAIGRTAIFILSGNRGVPGHAFLMPCDETLILTMDGVGTTEAIGEGTRSPFCDVILWPVSIDAITTFVAPSA